MSALCAVAEAHLGVQEQHQARRFFEESEGLEIYVGDVVSLANSTDVNCSKCLMNLTYQRLWSESLVKRTSW